MIRIVIIEDEGLIAEELKNKLQLLLPEARIIAVLRYEVPVVFITAFKKFMINAFEHNGIDYLLKPVEDKDILKVIHKYKMLDNHFVRRQVFFDSFAKLKKRLIVKKGLMTISLRLEDIVLFYTEDKIIYAIDKDARKYLCEENLTELGHRLATAHFFRANRQYIINAEYVRGYKTYEKVKLIIDLLVPLNNHPIIVSQETAPIFRKWMNAI